MGRRKARLFLGNLPQHSSEDDVQQRLQKYGTIDSVEIKHKKEFGKDTIASTFAYVNLDTEESTLQQCLRDLRNNDWDGSYIKAELAKESFLDRLKREREQASKPSLAHHVEKSHNTSVSFTSSSASLSVKEDHFNRKRKTSFNDDSGDDCEEDKLVSRLESFSDFWKDDPPAKPAWSPKKVRHSEHSSKHQFPKEEYSRNRSFHASNSVERPEKISDSFSAKPEVNANSQSTLSNTEKDPAAQASELRRFKALEEKSKALKQQKDAIKNALSSIDHAKPSNKIIFDDDGDPVSSSKLQPRAALNKHGKKNEKSNSYSENGQQTSKSNGQLQLFGGDDDDNDNWQGDFRFKKQFEGKKGRQLLEMQARFKDDDRFVIDERFYESDNETEDVDKLSAPATEEEKELQEEKAKEYEILASVLGQPVQPTVSKKAQFNPMVRFDPLKPNHAKFELPKPIDAKLKSVDIDKKKSGNDIGDKTERQRIDNEPLPVDDSQSYKVVSNIKELFKKNEAPVQSRETQGATFSLRQMFSSQHDEPSEEVEMPNSKGAETSQAKPRSGTKQVLRGFQDSKPLAMFSKKLLRPELNGLTNTFCKDVDVEAIKEKFSENRRNLGRMIHKKRVVLERQQHFKQKIGAASLAHKALDRESAIRRKSKPWAKKRGRR